MSGILNATLWAARALISPAPVQVEVTDNPSWRTEGNTIYVPRNVLSTAPSGADFEGYVQGKVLHECAHLLWTDKDIRGQFRSGFAQCEKAQTDWALAIGEMCEDVAVDRRAMLKWPHAVQITRRLWRALGLTKLASVEGGEQQNPVVNYILLRLRQSVLPDLVWASHLEGLAKAWPTGGPNRSDLDEALSGIDSATDTFQAMEVAKRIASVCGIQWEKPNKDPANNQAEGQPAPSQPENASQTAAQGDAEDKTGSEGESKPDGKNEPESPSSTEASCETGAQCGTAEPCKLDDEPTLTELMGWLPGYGKALTSEVKERAPTKIEQFRTKVLQFAPGIRSQIAELFDAFPRARWQPAQSGVLRAAHVWKLRTGNLAVFGRRQKIDKPSTAIKILLDRSSSMAGRMDAALYAAASVLVALEGEDGMQTSFSYFPGNSASTSVNIKGFDDGMGPFYERAAGLTADGGTPLLDALAECNDELADVTTDRRVLMVVTDGAPHSVDACRKYIQKMGQDGVEVIGIGIGAEARIVAKLFGRSTCIQDVSQLGPALKNALGDTLTAQSLLAA